MSGKAIVDGNLKLILGLIWTLILHYSISMPMWEEEEDDEGRHQTPKQRLLGWIQNKVPQLPITNFNRDWRDGKALGALVDNCAPGEERDRGHGGAGGTNGGEKWGRNCAPGLCPDWEKWDPNKPVQNAREAMQQADDWLGVPQVIAPEEIVDPNVDEHSVMTYLSQFPKAKLRPGAPLRPRPPQPGRARAYGPGIEPQGNVVLRPAQFTVETLEAGMGEVLVYVEDPEGHTEEVQGAPAPLWGISPVSLSPHPVPQLCVTPFPRFWGLFPPQAKVVPNNDKKRTYSVTYVPKVGGLHKVTVLFAGQNIDGSPFGVNVGMALGDASKVTARGPGLEPVGNVANKATYFDIYTAGAGPGDVGVVITDPQGRRDTVEVMLEDKGDNVFRCTYRPVLEGPHTICVTYAGTQIPRSPFTVNVAEACTPSAVRATGRGLQPRGVRVQDVADFKVLTRGAGSGDLRVTLRGPGGTEEPVTVRDVGDGVYECEYVPRVPGTYQVSITWGGYAIPRSPFEVQVSPQPGAQKVRAWGPGLEGGVVGRPADFVVEAVGTEVGTLGFSIEGPSQARIECDDKGDGSCDVRYWPTEPGLYAVHVVCDDEDIRDSPFMADIRPAPPNSWPDKVMRPTATHRSCCALVVPCCAPLHLTVPHLGVKAFGPGLEPTGCIVDRPAEFTIDARGAGKGPLKLYAQVKDNGDGTFHCVYVPTKAMKHTVIVAWGGVNTPNSPFRVGVIGGLWGAGVAVGVPGGVSVGEGSHPSRVKVHGPGVEKTGLKANEPTYFTVDCSEAGQGDVSIGIKCAPGVVGPLEADIDFDIIKNDNDTFTVKYTAPGAGLYTIMVLFANQEIPSSPFRIKVDPSHDASKVKAEGPGLSRTGVEVGTPTHFRVQTRGAGKAPLDVRFVGTGPGPAVADFEVIDNHDYSYTVKYTPLQQPYGCMSSGPPLESPSTTLCLVTWRCVGVPWQHPEVELFLQGPLSVVVTYGGDPIPKSPFPVTVAPPLQLGKVKVQGLNSKAEVGQVQEFQVEAQGAGGQGQLEVKVTGPSRRPVPCTVGPAPPGGPHPVTFTATEEGPHRVEVTYDGHPVPGSPFPVEALLPPDPSKVSMAHV
ncbi:hypothetical protein IHE44_0012722 [Lamprotornis superbus]|uniref:Calponin-homology (CH) domain-containing protein n=1 Tax=Lamprotornis superbus TaxID=245042 RepID=A0A835NGL9_9PASS|nr:hypothetical protein IHE44_0012722 [Lamprotornis superbus]